MRTTTRPTTPLWDRFPPQTRGAYWYNYAKSRGYTIEVYGDEFEPYPAWDGPATLLNVRAAVRRMVAEAGGPHDRTLFVMSGHGSGDKRGDSYLCLLPDPVVGTTSDERAGYYRDTAIAADLGSAGAAGKHFVFIDACLSGGIIEEVLDALPRVVGSTTATRAGFGYDSSLSRSGAWTATFLVNGLMASQSNDVDLAAHFAVCHKSYRDQYRSPVDQPCFFGRVADRRWNTEESVMGNGGGGTVSLPANVFRVADWL